jgi:tetratricopeptide (TPR) repeat protein
MNRILAAAAAAALLAGCSLVQQNQPNYDNPFYAKYLNTGSELDGRINQSLNELRQNPDSPALHNDLGMLLVQKGFPKDAAREFERAVAADKRFYPAWYNLGLVRAAADDELGARRAFRYTIHYKPGHAQALFQLGLIEEKRDNRDRAVDLYAKAFRIDPTLLSVRANPRILDSRLTHLALLKMYPGEHDRRSMNFLGTPGGWTQRQDPEAPSPESVPEKIVPPAPPATDPSQQPVKPPTD